MWAKYRKGFVQTDAKEESRVPVGEEGSQNGEAEIAKSQGEEEDGVEENPSQPNSGGDVGLSSETEANAKTESHHEEEGDTHMRSDDVSSLQSADLVVSDDVAPLSPTSDKTSEKCESSENPPAVSLGMEIDSVKETAQEEKEEIEMIHDVEEKENGTEKEEGKDESEERKEEKEEEREEEEEKKDGNKEDEGKKEEEGDGKKEEGKEGEGLESTKSSGSEEGTEKKEDEKDTAVAVEQKPHPKAVVPPNFSFENKLKPVVPSPYPHSFRPPPLSSSSSRIGLGPSSSPSPSLSSSPSSRPLPPTTSPSPTPSVTSSSSALSLTSKTLTKSESSPVLKFPLEFLRPMRACVNSKWIDEKFFSPARPYEGECCHICHTVFSRDIHGLERYAIHVMNRSCSPMELRYDRIQPKIRSLNDVSEKLLETAFRIPFSFCYPWWPLHRYAWTRAVCRSYRIADYRSILLFFCSSLQSRLFKKKWAQESFDPGVLPDDDDVTWDDLDEDTTSDNIRLSVSSELGRGGREKRTTEQWWRVGVEGICTLAQLAYAVRTLHEMIRWDALTHQEASRSQTIVKQEKILKRKVENGEALYLVRMVTTNTSYSSSTPSPSTTSTVWLPTAEVNLRVLQEFENRFVGTQFTPRGRAVVEGITCHQCHIKKPYSQLNYCGSCVLKYCDRCVLTRYGKLYFDKAKTLQQKKEIWECPKCLQACVCNQCIKKRRKTGEKAALIEGMDPTPVDIDADGKVGDGDDDGDDEDDDNGDLDGEGDDEKEK
jgi:hypothetical protein